MLTLAIKATLTTITLWFLCKVAVAIADHQTAQYESILRLIG